MALVTGQGFYNPTGDAVEWGMDGTSFALLPRKDMLYQIGSKTQRALANDGGFIDTTLFTIVGATELASFTTRASLFTGGTITGPATAGTVPAGALNQIGRSIGWELWGIIGNTATPNFTFDVALGATVIATTASFASVAITGYNTFNCRGFATVLTTGATGTMWVQGIFTYGQTVLLSTGIVMIGASATTVDLTAAKAFTFNATCGVSSASNKVTLTNGRVHMHG